MQGAEDAVRRRLVETVHRELDRVQRDSNPDAYTQWIDGVKDRKIEDIKPYGKSRFKFSYLRSAVQQCLGILQQTSPVDSGRYRSSHNVFVDGVPLFPVVSEESNFGPLNYSDLIRLDKEESALIIPTVSYARRIEEGKKPERLGGGPWSAHGDHVYRNAAAALRRYWNGVVLITFRWESIAVSGKNMRQPAIEIQKMN